MNEHALAERYALTLPGPATDASIELMMAFNPNLARSPGFQGRFYHLRQAIDLLWNEPRRREALARKLPYDVRIHDAFIWNEWTEMMMEAFCEGHENTVITGPNSSWKTTTAALYGLCAWYASPADTVVVLTSTSLPGLRRRIWKEITKFHRLQPAIGHVNASDYAIRFIKGSDEAGVFGIATGQDEGDVDKAFNKIIGFHAAHAIAILDEGQATNEAIVKGGVSLKSGTQRYQFIMLGNADSEMDAHGRMAEPAAGWNSITDESDRWETKNGICIHLDGLDSPRIKEGDQFYPGLLRQSDIESTIRDYGEDSPEFWRGRRGFWAPQGITKTVLSATMITKGNAREKAIWVDGYVVVLALDPSFEGMDRCVLRVFHCGQVIEGVTAIALKEIILIKVSVKSEEPIHYQIARRVKEECEARGVPPHRFGLDSTGEGGGLASIIVREWGPGIIMVEFGGRPSTDPVSETNPKRADQEYDRKVTELSFRFRTLVLNGQVRELDLDTATEFCQRRFGMKGNLISVETKTEMKLRTRKSPDLKDNALVGAEVCRKLGLLKNLESKASLTSSDRWKRLAREHAVTSDYALAD